jgi:hypothetical protein
LIYVCPKKETVKIPAQSRFFVLDNDLHYPCGGNAQHCFETVTDHGLFTRSLSYFASHKIFFPRPEWFKIALV